MIFQAIVGPFSGLACAWVVAYHLKGMYDKKDKESYTHITSHVNTLEQLIKVQSEETKHCNERYNILLRHVLNLRNNQLDKDAKHAQP